MATYETALRRRISITLAFFNTEVLPAMIRGMGMRVRAACRSGVTCFNKRKVGDNSNELCEKSEINACGYRGLQHNA